MSAGVTVIGEVNQLTTHVMNVLWLLGTFTFAIVIGIIGEDVTNTIMVSFIYHMQNFSSFQNTKVSIKAGRMGWGSRLLVCDAMPWPSARLQCCIKSISSVLLKTCMRVQNVRSGNYSVMAANHTLILNWNDQTVPLLRQIAINRTERADNIYDG